MDYKLKEACREITKKIFERDAIKDKKDAEEFRSFINIWIRELDVIDDDLHWKGNN